LKDAADEQRESCYVLYDLLRAVMICRLQIGKQELAYKEAGAANGILSGGEQVSC
jgi:hypothetical protein